MEQGKGLELDLGPIQLNVTKRTKQSDILFVI